MLDGLLAQCGTVENCEQGEPGGFSGGHILSERATAHARKGPFFLNGLVVVFMPKWFSVAVKKKSVKYKRNDNY